MRHTFREAWSGLRRNFTMALAVVVTMWVSLTLFGSGLMTAQQVGLLKDKWYDKAEVSVFMCVKDSQGGVCSPGKDATDAQRAAVKKALEASPDVVQPVFYETKAEAYESFRKTFANSPILESLTVDQMQDSFRVKLRDPNQWQGVVTEMKAMPGVQNVQDQHVVLGPVFLWLNALKWGTIGMSALLLLAAALQIGNTIRLSAFSRRRELGIMRLVGASNAYIMTPFIIESLVAGLLGAGLACGTLALGYWAIIVKRAIPAFPTLNWITWTHAAWVMAGVVALSVLLSVIPTLLTSRRYLKI